MLSLISVTANAQDPTKTIYYTATEELEIIDDYFDVSKINNDYDSESQQGWIEFEDYPTAISGPFAGNPKCLTSFTLPSSVTTLGEDAFGSCENLTSITMPGVTTIGYEAFRFCYALSAIDLSNVEAIGEGAFEFCSALSAVNNLSSKVTEISSRAFTYCNALSAIDLSNVTTIGGNAFQNCFKLPAIDLSNVTTIGGYAFQNCYELLANDLSNVTTIGEYAFQYCYELSANDLSNVTTIGEYAFQNCSALSANDLSNVTTIGEYAFQYCYALSAIDLSNVKTIGEYAFSNCKGLKEITVHWTTAEAIPTLNPNVFYRITLANITLNVPSGTRSIYEAKDVWKDFDINDAFTLNDAEPYTATEDIENVTVNYKRTFAATGKYEALYLPFSVTMTEDLLSKITISKIYMVSTKGSVEGGATDAGVNVVVVKTLGLGESTKPHTPYFIRLKDGTDLEFTQENTDIYAATDAQPGHIECATTMDKYDFIGSYTGETLTPEAGKAIYVLQGGALHKLTSETDLPCNRWQMVKTPTEWNDDYKAPVSQAMTSIVTLGEDETTGIIGLDASMSADSANDAIYTPAGVAVSKQQLIPGLYIQYGKKFIVE